ncbi:MAG: amidohydrolase family protein [Candidatus Heimdallarchaeota archaeon]|nr:amidohydrolase family protein [Candidatus Heimdallarchaeota archaeon]
MERLVFSGASVLNVLNGKLEENRTIVSEGNQFKWIGDEGGFEKQDGDTIIDVSNKYVIPGLMDLHVHLEFAHKDMANFGSAFLKVKDPMRAYLALHRAQRYVPAGFTTLRDCGSGATWGADLRRVFEQKMYYGPRLLVAQNTIGQYGDQEAFGPEDLIRAEKEEFEVLSGPDGVIHAVRDRKRSGSDFIKTTSTGGVLHGQESKVERSLWRLEELEAMASEADRLGMHVAAHAHGNQGIYNAVVSGIQTIEHGTLIQEETADEMIKRGTYLVPTQSAATFLINMPPELEKQFPPEVLEKGRFVATQMVECHKMAFEKGVNFALGTDAPVGGEHCHSAKELGLMVSNVGMTPIQAIQTATINAARAIRREESLGSIEVGKIADFVVLNQNPLDNIAVLEDLNNLRYVVKDGTIMAESGKLTQL